LPFSTTFKIESESISKFIKRVGIQNKNTAKQYQSRLLSFERFVLKEYKKSNVDKLIQQLKDKEIDPYDILNDYCLFLKNNNISSLTFKEKIITVKTFLEYNDIEISPRKFKLKVRYPKSVLKHKEAIDKNDIVRILNGCSDIKLKSYVMLLAGTGCRATEALSIRLKDLDFESNLSAAAKIRIRGEFTKTKINRYIFITKELKEQLQKWLDFKYRTRRICYRDSNGKTITEYRTPEKNPDELIFSIYQVDNPNPESLYNRIAADFAKTLDRIGMGSREDGNDHRRKITLHSFRRFVKSTISDLGYSDYSEWFIGHSGSTYWRKKDSEKAEIFKKIEPYLTFLNIPQLERQGADLQTKIEELQDVNQLLRNKYNEKETQIKNLEESVSFLADKFNTFLLNQPGNRLVYYQDNDNKTNNNTDPRNLKGIELNSEISNNALGTVIPSSSTSTNNKKK
jgi:integrase